MSSRNETMRKRVFGIRLDESHLQWAKRNAGAIRHFIETQGEGFIKRTTPAAVTPTLSKFTCLRDKPEHPNPQMQEAQCNACRANSFNTWRACQDLRREQQREP